MLAVVEVEEVTGDNRLEAAELVGQVLELNTRRFDTCAEVLANDIADHLYFENFKDYYSKTLIVS